MPLGRGFVMVGKISGSMDQMQQLSKDFSTSSGEVQSLTSRLDGIVNGTIGSGWEGNAANRFRELWQGEFKSALSKLDQALADASREVENRKQALIQADS